VAGGVEEVAPQGAFEALVDIAADGQHRHFLGAGQLLDLGGDGRVGGVLDGVGDGALVQQGLGLVAGGAAGGMVASVLAPDLRMIWALRALAGGVWSE